MVHCQICNRSMTSIEAANCKNVECAVRDLAMFGPIPPKPPTRDFPKRRSTTTDPQTPRRSMTTREHMATEFAKARLSNPAMYGPHGARFVDVANDAVGWADALIERLDRKETK